MKAREENGIITVYTELPNDWGNILNFRMAPEGIHQAMGFFDVEEPILDPVTQELGSLYFDSQTRLFKYLILPKLLPTLEDAKTAKIRELKEAVKPLYNTVQWLVEMHRIEGEAIPTEVTDKIREIRTKYNQAKNQINGMTTIVDVLMWEVPRDQIQTMKETLEALG